MSGDSDLFLSLATSTNSSNGSSSQQCKSLDATFPIKIGKIAVFSIILLSSLSGNTLIIILVYKRKELRKTVNYFIVNMAVSDFVFSLTTVPVSLAKVSLEIPSRSWQWHVGGTAGIIFCKLNNFLMAVSLTVSIESLVWIAFDRFVAVVLPMKLHLISSTFRAFAIASTWIAAVMINSIELHVSDLVEENDEIMCKGTSNSLLYISTTYVRIAIIYIAPLIVITVFYGAIAVCLRRQDKVLRCAASRRNDQIKRQAIRMSICVVVTFYVLFLPFIILLSSDVISPEKSCLLFDVLWQYASLSVSLSSTSNPIICFTFAKSYRRGLREMFNSCKRNSVSTENTAIGGHEGITLQHIRVITAVGDSESYL